jgi:hypothetical protein
MPALAFDLRPSPQFPAERSAYLRPRVHDSDDVARECFGHGLPLPTEKAIDAGEAKRAIAVE